jgi:hypothetical protein
MYKAWNIYLLSEEHKVTIHELAHLPTNLVTLNLNINPAYMIYTIAKTWPMQKDLKTRLGLDLLWGSSFFFLFFPRKKRAI